MFSSMAEHTVVVTGGSRGIGRGIATIFVEAGARVVLVGRRAAELAAVAEELGPRTDYLVADIGDRGQCREMAAEVVRRHGGIDVLCCNAGIFPQHRLSEMTQEDLDLVMRTNLSGTVFSVQACTDALAACGRGRIVLTSSITGPITGYPGWSHYGASKAAQLGFMRSAALELARQGITINAVMPGNIATEGLDGLGDDYVAGMAAAVPAGRLGSVADIGHAVLFFAAPETGYVTGQTLIVDGGQILPESAEALAQM
ncbi:3-oxoacyl-ACP reductase FabG [Gordonia phthalatica]|uniref:3-ketoacyl-ACP reductase n=1 Tax=Gordonia phthalatica TaxID=1136941 RepID=A0A0N9MMM0_9ACTN|nr:3-oxoacyl-ACP reductase FabG [Gordonia phthalatica]ALG83288.1 3-ketoacyl-ACP reductase [Gordonia phthalatica]